MYPWLESVIFITSANSCLVHTLQNCKQSPQNLFISGQFKTKKAPVHLQLEFLLASYWRELHGLAYLRNERNPADKNTYKIFWCHATMKSKN